MRQHGYNVGGEQSGHIILSDYGTTGDGLVAALQMLAVVKRTGKTVSESATASSRCRSSSRTSAFGRQAARGHSRQKAIADAEAELAKTAVSSSAPPAPSR
jgi:phosphoglucosamine mutase